MLPKIWYSNNQACETTAESLRVRNLFNVDIHQSTVLYAWRSLKTVYHEIGDESKDCTYKKSREIVHELAVMKMSFFQQMFLEHFVNRFGAHERSDGP